MANKPVKRWSTPWTAGETQVETTTRCHYAVIRIITVERTDTTSAGEDTEELELSGIATLEKSDRFLHKVKYALTIWPSNLTFWYLPVKNEHFCSHKNLYVSVEYSSVCNGPKLQTLYMPVSRAEWMNRATSVHGVLLNNIKEQTQELGWVAKVCAEWAPEGYILEDSTYITFSNR